MADEKKLSIVVEIIGKPNEAEMIEKLNLSLKQLAESKKVLTRALQDGKITEEQYIRNMASVTKEVNTQKDSLKTLKDSVSGYTSQISKLGKELLGFMGISAGINGLIELGKKAIDSTQGSAAKMAEVMTGFNQSTEKFFQMIASGDTKDFFANMKKAYDSGIIYAQELRKIEERRLGLSLLKAESDAHQTELLTAARNVELSVEEREKAITEWKKKGKELATDDLTLSQKALDNKDKELAGIGIQGQKLQELYRNYNADIKTIEETERKVIELQKLNPNKLWVDPLDDSGKSQAAFNKQKKQYDDLYATLTDDEKKYADLLSNNDKVKKGDLVEYIELLKAIATSKNEYNEVDKQARKVENTIFKATAKEETAASEELTKQEIENTKIRIAATKREADEKMKLAKMGFQPVGFGITKVTAGKISEETQKSVTDIGNIIDKANENIRKDQEAHDRAMLDMAARTSESKMNIASAAVGLLKILGGKTKSIQKAALIAEGIVAIAHITIQAKIARMATTAWGDTLSIPTMGASVVAATIINAKNKITEMLDIGSIIASMAVGFARGGKINRGIPINTGTVDNRLIAVNDTETVLTSRHVAMLGGSGVMQRAGVPGYVNGGYVGQQAPVMPAAGFDYNAMAQLMNSKEVTLNTNKVITSIKEVQIINQTQKI